MGAGHAEGLAAPRLHHLTSNRLHQVSGYFAKSPGTICYSKPMPDLRPLVLCTLLLAGAPQLAYVAEKLPVGATVDDSYRIGPGDVLQVFVWRNAELTTSVPVRPDGKISTPLVDDMVAVGKTPSQLARDLESVLGEYIRSPQVNIIVSEPASVFSQVKVIGEVEKPQSIPFRKGMTVLDAVLAAGGLSKFAAGNRAHLVRTENGKERQLPVRIEDLVNRGELKYNVPMEPGDILLIPQSRF